MRERLRVTSRTARTLPRRGDDLRRTTRRFFRDMVGPMTPWRTHAVALAAGTCSLCVGARAQSVPDGAAAPVHLSVDAGPGCPDAATFEARVRARVPFTIAPEGAAARHFDVSLRSEGDQSQGVLETRSIDGTTAERRVVGRSCDEVASALALVVSVAIDGGDAAPPPALAPQPAPAVAFPEDGQTPASRPVAIALPDQPAREQAPVSRRGASRLEVELGAEALFMGGIAPTTLIAASPFVGIQSFAGFLPDPAIRLAFEHASTDIDAALGTAELSWTAARLDLCPARFQLSTSTGVRPCLMMDAGVLQGRGVKVEHPATRSRPWFDLGGALRIDVKVLGPLYVEAAGSVFFPTIRDDFGIDPGSSIHRAPVIAGSGSAGLALLFP
jgi:hypothetical protein